MKKLKNYIGIFLIALFATSCLESGLDELPAFDEANIVDFNFEYRWIGKTSGNDLDRLYVIPLTTNTVIDEVNNTVTCEIMVPIADASKDFPEDVRAEITLANIVGYSDISTAASLVPVGDSPELGVISDFSATSMQYKVTAANETTSKVWTLNITEFNK